MRFSHITLENWRNFSHVDVELQTRAFLVGPNASGKSNFLDVFTFLRDLVKPGGGFEEAVNSRGGVSRVRNLAARYPSTDVVIEVILQNGDEGNWRYRIAFGQDNQRRPILRQEKIWNTGRLIQNRPDSEDRKDEERLRQTLLEQTFVNRDFREIADFFSSVQYFHLVPQLVREPERSARLKGDPFGSDFLELIADERKNVQEARLRRILGVLRAAVPQLTELKLERDEKGNPHLLGNYEHWRPSGAWQNEADFSDGTLRLIGLLWSLMAGSGPLLLEEPELSLHPGVVRYIPQMMLRVQRERKTALRQIILSTHSSDLLQDEGIAPDEVLLFIPSNEGSVVRLSSDIEEVERLLDSGLSMADAVIPLTRPENATQLALF